MPIAFAEVNLNTSHVNVNLINRHYAISKHNHLNTSHVNVNLIFIYVN